MTSANIIPTFSCSFGEPKKVMMGRTSWIGMAYSSVVNNHDSVSTA